MNQIRKLTLFFTILVIAFTPLDAIEISQGSNTTLGRYFFIAMAASALFSGDLIPKQSTGIFKLLVGFILWASLSTLWSVAPDVTFSRILLLIQYAVIFVVMVNVLDTPTKLRLAMCGWIIGSAYIAYKTATDYSQYAVGSDRLYRVLAYGNPNENCFMLCYALVFCYIIDKTKLRIPSIVFTAYSIFAVIANGSRMGIILFVIAVSAFCVQLWQSKKRWYVYLLVPCIISGGMYMLDHIPTATLMRILGIIDNIEEGDLANRQNIWEATFEMLNANSLWYIIGCGWGAFPVAIRDFLGYNKGAHNFYLDLIASTGFIGFSIVMYYLKKLFSIIRKTNKATIMNYLMLGLPMISMMSTNWQSRRWWFIMGALIYLIYKTGNFSANERKKIKS
ncbi:MAG: O-antigen ligase family protein [Odoribacter sp.]|nr:O-antigen ligase family protein [Odoribacter sp.]